jgi:hypothetical protein
VPDNTEQRLTLPQAEQARTDFAIIETELEAIHARLAVMPTRIDLARAAFVGMLGGACLAQTLAFLFR